MGHPPTGVLLRKYPRDIRQLRAQSQLIGLVRTPMSVRLPIASDCTFGPMADTHPHQLLLRVKAGASPGLSLNHIEAQGHKCVLPRPHLHGHTPSLGVGNVNRCPLLKFTCFLSKYTIWNAYISSLVTQRALLCLFGKRGAKRERWWHLLHHPLHWFQGGHQDE